MDEHRAIAPAVLRHALRALLLLGGAVVFWLAFSGGAAQADGVDDTGTTDGLREAPATVLEAANAVTTPKPVHAVVTKLTTRIEPTLTTATASLADTVDQAVGSAQTLVAPVTRATTGLSAPATSADGSSGRTQDARSHSHRERPAAATGAATASAPAGAGHDGDVSPSVDASLGDPGARDHGVPEAPAAPAVPAGSSSAPSCGLAALGGEAFIPPALSRGRSARDQAAVHPGPAYPPGCSPD